MKFNYFALAILILLTQHTAINTAAAELNLDESGQLVLNNNDKPFLDVGLNDIRSIGNSTTRLFRLKITGLQKEPTFSESWYTAETPQRRGEVLIYTINKIRENPDEMQKLIEELECTLANNSEPITAYALELANERIKEIKEQLAKELRASAS